MKSLIDKANVGEPPFASPKKLFENNPNFVVKDEPFYVELEEEKLAALERLKMRSSVVLRVSHRFYLPSESVAMHSRMIALLALPHGVKEGRAFWDGARAADISHVDVEDTFPVVEALVARAKGWS